MTNAMLMKKEEKCSKGFVRKKTIEKIAIKIQ